MAWQIDARHRAGACMLTNPLCPSAHRRCYTCCTTPLTPLFPHCPTEVTSSRPICPICLICSTSMPSTVPSPASCSMQEEEHKQEMPRGEPILGCCNNSAEPSQPEPTATSNGAEATHLPSDFFSCECAVCPVTLVCVVFPCPGGRRFHLEIPLRFNPFSHSGSSRSHPGTHHYLLSATSSFIFFISHTTISSSFFHLMKSPFSLSAEPQQPAVPRCLIAAPGSKALNP
jgi:hypothetical protein